MLLIFIVLLNFIVGAILFYNFYYKRRNLPPGPTPLPLIGNLWSLMRNEPGDHQFLKWSREYGPIYTYWVGELAVVCLTDFNKIIETFQKDGETYAGRYSTEEFNKLIKGGTAGVIFTEGDIWKDQRRFTLHVLRDFGLGKNLMQENVLAEVEILISKVDAANLEGKTAHDLPSHIDMAVGSIINLLLFGYGFNGGKEAEFLHLKKLVSSFVKSSGHPLTQLIHWNPNFLKNLPVFKSRFAKILENHNQLFQFYEERIREHEAEIDMYEPATDYVAAFLKEKAKRDKLGEPHHYKISQLKSMCFDLWVAGQETTSTTLAWCFVYMIYNPKALDQLYKELDRVIREDRQITLADRPNLPFTNAVVNETQRVCNLVPQNVFHKTTRDVTIYGHFIPKGTCIVPQISAVLCNDEIFEKAENFDPTRFLDESGQLKKCDELIPFSLGKRQCLGESLARMELFLFVANIFNTFKVSAAATLPSLKRSFGGTVACPPYLCRMQRRHT